MYEKQISYRDLRVVVAVLPPKYNLTPKNRTVTVEGTLCDSPVVRCLLQAQIRNIGWMTIYGDRGIKDKTMLLILCHSDEMKQLGHEQYSPPALSEVEKRLRIVKNHLCGFGASHFHENSLVGVRANRKSQREHHVSSRTSGFGGFSLAGCGDCFRLCRKISTFPREIRISGGIQSDFLVSHMAVPHFLPSA